jgi:hypothetical protein
MLSQWDNFLQNLGEWRGSFTKISPAGEVLGNSPTILSLEGLESNETVRLTLRYFSSADENYAQPHVRELVREYRSIGRDMLFFETGAFSQGTIQLAPFSEFGGEFCLISGNRRLRLVQLFNLDGELASLTLIREKRAGSEAAERPTLTLNQLLGEWQGEAITLYPDWRPPDTYSTVLKLQDLGAGRVAQQLSFGTGTVSSTGRVEGNIIKFEELAALPVRVLLLPDGASATCPQKVQLRQPLFLELGWLIEPNLRQRLIRRYSEKGEWVSLTLVTERKVRS